jgi:hypothetical protein
MITITLWNQVYCEFGSTQRQTRREVCSLQFLEARTIRKGGDSSRVQLFLCRDIQRTLEATLQNLHYSLLELGVQFV